MAAPSPDNVTQLLRAWSDGDLAARVRSGALAVAVEATYPIEEIKAALAHAGREGRAGKILVTPNGPVG